MSADTWMVGLLGVIGSGVANGSFAVPEKHIRLWRWEHTWLMYSLCGLGIIPVALVLFFAPEILTQTLLTHPSLTIKVSVCGLLFGIGSVLFGVSLARLGIAVTNALVSGVVVFLGSVGPLIIGIAHIDSVHLMWLLAGLTTLVASLALCAWASLRRERSAASLQSIVRHTSSLTVALTIAFLAGALSSILNIGFAYGEPLIQHATLHGASLAMASMAVWIPALLGGLVMNAGYPAYLISRNGSWRALVGQSAGRNQLLAASMGALWFGSELLYGYGALHMGEAGSVYGWALSSGASILVSNTWGVMVGEWDGSKASTKALMWISTALLVLSFVILIVKRMPS